MNEIAKCFIVVAVAFAVTGDYFLRRYSDTRSWFDVITCLTLWEVCAVMWVFAYRQHVPLGRSTVMGAALSITANVVLGLVVFAEPMKLSQWIGAGCVLVGLFLVG